MMKVGIGVVVPHIVAQPSEPGAVFAGGQGALNLAVDNYVIGGTAGGTSFIGKVGCLSHQLAFS